LTTNGHQLARISEIDRDECLVDLFVSIRVHSWLKSVCFQRDGLRDLALDGAVLRLCFLLALGLLSSGLPVLAEFVWTHERTNLPVDPEITWGVLPNGVRYAIRPNAEPKGRISLRFLVQAGSMHENDDERGLAHFLEHMAFRSTRDHPEGSLVANLQRLGIGFGPDNTAFTTHEYT